ncbi:MAG: cell surface protein, partial [Paludibacteraceae bacterium]|nr:cell surface protein [Paludibacteraceae bacterium]
MRRLFTLIVTFCSVAAFAVSPYINKVYEFVPAPGQFINTMPAYTEGDTEATMLEKVDNALKGKAPATMICLGAFGGYVTVGFDHPIVNVKGQKDFLVYGNAFAGNAEPGVIMVMQDENGNGLPDDTWYEIAGSEYGNKSTRFNYEITYYKPSAEDDAATIAIDEYIRWTDNLGGEGFIPKNTFYSQP